MFAVNHRPTSSLESSPASVPLASRRFVPARLTLHAFCWLASATAGTDFANAATTPLPSNYEIRSAAATDDESGLANVLVIDDAVDLTANDHVAEQIFLAESPSSRTVSAFSRNTEALSLLGAIAGSDLTFKRSFNPLSTAQFSDPTAATPAQPGIKARSSDLDFWQAESAETVDVASRSASVSSAPRSAADPSQASVLIPLPTAVSSGLSVFGGLGIAAGVRKMFRRR